VRIDTRFQGSAPARVGGGIVTFEPGARTAWHTHPLGQTLIVTAGFGWVQRDGGPKEEIRPGDIVWIPAGEKHWHGATANTAMSHIAIAETLDGKSVDWMEKVSDEQYRADRAPQGVETMNNSARIAGRVPSLSIALIFADIIAAASAMAAETAKREPLAIQEQGSSRSAGRSSRTPAPSIPTNQVPKARRSMPIMPTCLIRSR
jgi:quercetin dioxygenase-like cupin family protein